MDALIEVLAILIPPDFRPIEGKRVFNLLEPLIGPTTNK